MPSKLIHFITAFMIVATAAAVAQAPLRLIGWNVESGGSDLATIRNEIASFDDIDLWGLSEVPDQAAAILFENGAEEGEDANFEAIIGTTGNSDRLVILYDADRFSLQDAFELSAIQLSSGLRAALVAQLREAATGLEFLFVVNHLARSNTSSRHQQARLLNAWAQQQSLPVIAVGDYNFDYEVVGGQSDHDPGFDLLLADDVFSWLRPEVLVRTQCSADLTAVTEDDCTFDSVLDFVFVAAGAQAWAGRSEIVVRPADFPDSDSTSDHRPLYAEFPAFGVSTEGNAMQLAEILAQLEALEAELEALKQQVLGLME